MSKELIIKVTLRDGTECPHMKLSGGVLILRDVAEAEIIDGAECTVKKKIPVYTPEELAEKYRNK